MKRNAAILAVLCMAAGGVFAQDSITNAIEPVKQGEQQ